MSIKKWLTVVTGCALLFALTACSLMKSTPPKTDEEFVKEIYSQAKNGSIIDYNAKEVHLGSAAPKDWKKIDVNNKLYEGMKEGFEIFRDVYESQKGDAFAGLNKGKVEALFSLHREYKKRLTPELIKKVIGKPKEEKKEKNEVVALSYELTKTTMLHIDFENSNVIVHSSEWKYE